MEPPTSNLILPADAAIDLQMHTTYSDGTWTPEALVDYLVGEQFGLGAVTDHDRLDSVPAVQRLGAQKGLPLLAAVEMSTSWNGGATDVLCYGFDPANNELEALGRAVILKQREITQENYEELKRRGYQFPREQEILGEKRAEQLMSCSIGSCGKCPSMAWKCITLPTRRRRSPCISITSGSTICLPAQALIPTARKRSLSNIARSSAGSSWSGWAYRSDRLHGHEEAISHGRTCAWLAEYGINVGYSELAGGTSYVQQSTIFL